jgi:hypothetical protein
VEPARGAENQPVRVHGRTRAFASAINRWIFVRGEFFDKNPGCIFETGAGGEIKSVKYQLKLP